MSEVTAALEGVRKRHGDVAALDGIDFVRAGEVLGVLGPTGPARPWR